MPTCSLAMITRAEPGEVVLVVEDMLVEEVGCCEGEVSFADDGDVERAMALLTMARMRLMSLYDARNTMGVDAISMFMRLCPETLRLSTESVISASSRKRRLSALLST
jgi:hypothetical protein